MAWLKRTLSSSLGMKYLMAITGLGLFGFVLAHLSGNLLLYAGQDALNTYAKNLQNLGALLWVARGGLLVIFLLHISVGLRLAALNKQARPIAYSHKNTVQASYASRTMPMSGLILLLFVGYHLMHFTLFGVDPQFRHLTDASGRHDVFSMVVMGFQNPWVSGFYIASMLVLGLHMSHGLSSFFQSLGINHANINPLIRLAGPIIAWAIAFGNISLPVSVLAGIITLPQGGL